MRPAQVEARLRQLEGKALAGDSGRPRGKPDAPKYDAARQGGAGAALLSAPKAYNPDADVTGAAGKDSATKKKKARALATASPCSECYDGLPGSKCACCPIALQHNTIFIFLLWTPVCVTSFAGSEHHSVACRCACRVDFRGLLEDADCVLRLVADNRSRGRRMRMQHMQQRRRRGQPRRQRWPMAQQRRGPQAQPQQRTRGR
jgi:hypothetical protein